MFSRTARRITWAVSMTNGVTTKNLFRRDTSKISLHVPFGFGRKETML